MEQSPSEGHITCIVYRRVSKKRMVKTILLVRNKALLVVVVVVQKSYNGMILAGEWFMLDNI